MSIEKQKELAKKYAKEEHERAKTHPKFEKMKSEMGRKQAIETALSDLNNKQYTYVVKKTDIIKRGGDVPTDSAISNTNVLTLISCWPPGKDYQRIAVTAELLNN